MASNDLELALRIRAAFEGQQALVNLGTSFVEINKKVENLQRGLQALTGSAEGALKEFEYLEEVSKKFGLSIIDLADNYVKLSASARETNLEGEATKKIFESVASTMAVLGGDTITTERAFRALGQMMSKGQIYAEELKGQLAEAIPGAIQIMSRSLGVGTQDLLQLMEAGQLGADVLLPFAQQLEKEYGSLAASTTTFTQAINRIQTEWTLLAKQIGDTGAFNALSKVLELVGKNAEVMAGAVGSLATVGLVMLGKGMVSAVTGLTSYATATRFAANATQQASVATLARAEADAVAATAARTHTTSVLNAATAAELAARGTGLHAVAVRELKIAQAQAAIASNNYIAATKGVKVAQDALIASQGLLSRAWTFMTGPAGLIALMVASFVAMTVAFRGQDEATKTLAKSTDEYTKEVEKLTTAQLALLDAKAKEAVDDNAKRIQNIKDEINYLNQRLEKEKEGTFVYEARKLSIYGLTNSLKVWLSTEELLTQAQSDLDEATNNLSVSEGKQALAVNALASKYYELVEAEKTHSKTIADTNTDINEQKKSIESARTAMYGMINAYGTWSTEAATARANVGQATEGLIALQAKQINQGVVLKNTQDQSNKAIDAYTQATGASREAVLAALTGNQQAIDQLDVKSKKIAESIQESVRLIQEEKVLSAQYKQTKAELEAYTRSVTANIEAKVKIAQADGDLAALRDAEINKAKTLEDLSARELKVNQDQLALLQSRMANEQVLLTLNAKGAADTQKRIDKLSLEITAQQGMIDQKKADVAATQAQSAAVERANTLIGSALVQQQQAIITTQNELAELQATYDRLSSSGESITVLNGLLEQMRQKQAEVAEQTEAMRADMIAAFAAVGLNYEEVMTGMDFETRRQIDALGALGKQAGVTSNEIQKAFNNAFTKSDTIAELNELSRKLELLGINGKVSGNQVAVGVAAIQTKLAQLRGSLDPVQQSLEKLGIGVPEQLKAIAKENEVLYNVIKKSKAPIDEVDKAFLKYAESQLLAAEHGAKVDLAALKNEASTRGLSAAFAELQRRMAEVDPEIVALVAAMDRYNTIVQRTNALNEQQREVNNQVIESQKGIAEIIGDKNLIAKEELKLAEAAVQNTIQRINDIEEEKDAIDGLIKKLIEKQKAEGLNPEETDALQQYQDEAQAKQLVIDKANEELLLKQKIAEQAAIDAGPIGEAIRQAESAAAAINVKVAAMEKELEMSLKLQQQKVTDEQQDLDLLEADKELLGVAKEGLEAELAKAVAEKDVDEQNEIRLKIADNLIKQAEQEVKIAEQKVELAKELVAMAEAEEVAAIKKAKAYREQAAAQQRLMEAERAKMEASDGLNEEEKEQLANMAARIAGLKSQAISEDAAADAAAASIELGEKQVKITEKGVDAAKKRVEAAKAEKEALEDQIAAQDDDTDSKDKNTKSTRSNTDAKQDAEQAARDLAAALEEQRRADEEAKKAAEEAAEAERERLKAMKEAAEEAQREVDNLKADLLKETGFDQEADLLSQMVDYQTQREQLAKAIQEAEGAGNSALVAALNEQLSLIDKINTAKVQNIQDDYAQEAADRQLEATQQIADATQQLTEVLDEAANERLAIEAEHLEAIDALNEQAQADRLAQVQQNKEDLIEAESEYRQARKDQEQETDDEIRTVRQEHQQALLDLEKAYQQAVLDEQANLIDEFKDENKEAAKDVEALYEDAADSIKDLNRDVAKDLQEVTKDLAKDLQAVADDLVKDMADATSELDRDFGKADRDSAKKIEEVYADLGQSIIDQQADTQRELLELEQDRAKDTQDLYSDSAEKAAEAATDYREKLADLSSDLSDSLAESRQDLAKAVQDENEKLAESLADLNEDTLDKMDDLATDTAKSIAEVTADTTKDLADLAKDTQKEIQDTNDDLAKAMVEFNEDAAQSVLELNADTSKSIEELYADSRDEVAKIQQDFADKTQALRDQLVQDALDATQSLADKSEEMRRTLLGEQGEQGQVVDAEFGDELQSLAQLYAESGDSAKESFTTAVDQAKELYSIQLEEMLKSGELSKKQYAEAKASMEERLSLTQEIVNEQKAVLAEEQNAQLAELSAERDQLLAEQQAATDEKRRQIEEESALKSAAIQQEKAEKIAAAQEEQAEKLLLIEEERAEKARSLQEESELKKQAILEESILRQQAIEVEAEQKREAFAQDSIERQADLQVEFAERQAKLNEESAKKQADQAKDHQQKLDDIQKELDQKLAANALDFADKKQKVVDEEALKIAEDRRKAADKEAELIEDLAYKKQLLQEEYALELIELQRLSAEKRAEREQEAVEKKAEIELEKLEKLQAIKDEAEEKKAQRAEELQEALADLEIESQARLAKLQEEYRLSQDAEQQESAESLAELNRESAEKLRVLSTEFQEKRKLLQDEQAFALRAINDTYQAELLLLNQKTQAELTEAKKKADQSVLLAQENIQSIEQQVEFELALARAKDLQAESQVRLNNSMKETLTLTKSISEQMGALASSSLSGLSQQAFDLKQTLQDIEAVL